MVSAPFETAVIHRYPDRAAWDAEAADLVARMLQRWKLTTAEALTGGEAGAALLVHEEDGSAAVLKVGFPHLESIWEAVALDAWSPMTPAVLRQDEWTWALLLERVSPGTPLSRAELEPLEAVAIGARRHAELTAVAAPSGIPALEDYVGHFAGIAAGRLAGWQAQLDRLGSRSLVERAIAELPELAGTADRRVFLHGDYNPGNLLAADDGSWRVIDPNPLVGDPAFDPWPLIEQLGAPWKQERPEVVLLRNATVACDLAGADRDRVLRWAFARTGLNVTWYLEDGDLQHAADEVAKLEVLDRMLR